MLSKQLHDEQFSEFQILFRAWNRSPSAFLLYAKESNGLKSIQMSPCVYTKMLLWTWFEIDFTRNRNQTKAKWCAFWFWCINLMWKVHVLCYIWYVSSPKQRWHHVSEHVVNFAVNSQSSVVGALNGILLYFFYVYVRHSLALLWTAIYVECVYMAIRHHPSRPIIIRMNKKYKFIQIADRVSLSSCIFIM